MKVKKKVILTSNAEHYNSDGEITKTWNFTKDDMLGMVSDFYKNKVKRWIFPAHSFIKDREPIGELSNLEVIDTEHGHAIISDLEWYDDGVNGYVSPELAYQCDDQGNKHNFKIKAAAIVKVPAMANVDEINEYEFMASFSASEEENMFAIIQTLLEKIKGGDAVAKKELADKLIDQPELLEVFIDSAITGEEVSDTVDDIVEDSESEIVQSEEVTEEVTEEVSEESVEVESTEESEETVAEEVSEESTEEDEPVEEPAEDSKEDEFMGVDIIVDEPVVDAQRDITDSLKATYDIINAYVASSGFEMATPLSMHIVAGLILEGVEPIEAYEKLELMNPVKPNVVAEFSAEDKMYQDAYDSLNQKQAEFTNTDDVLENAYQAYLGVEQPKMTADESYDKAIEVLQRLN